MAEPKDTASRLWENLNQGLDEVYEKYKALRAANDTAYAAANAALDPKYREMKNAAGVQSRIAQANTDRRMAENGLGASGEALKRELLESAALQQNLTALDLARAGEKEKLDAEQRKSSSELDAKESGEVSDYVYSMNRAYFDQLNTDREQALNEEKLRQSEEQNAFEREMKEKELALKEKQQAFEQEIEKALNDAKVAEAYASAAAKNASASSSKSSSSKSASAKSGDSDPAPAASGGGSILGIGGSKFLFPESGSVTPGSFKPKELVEDIAAKNSYKDENGRTRYNKNAIKLSVTDILNNTSLDVSYRYEVRLYATSLGYL